jgi:hypothetical protein
LHPRAAIIAKSGTIGPVQSVERMMECSGLFGAMLLLLVAPGSAPGGDGKLSGVAT